MRPLMLVSFVLILLSGCAGKFTGNAVSLTVTRAKWNSDAKVYLLLGGTQLGPLKPGDSSTLTFRPGTYLVGVKVKSRSGANVRSIAVEFKSRSHMCLLIGARDKGAQPRAVLDLIRCKRHPGEALKPISIPMIGGGR